MAINLSTEVKGAPSFQNTSLVNASTTVDKLEATGNATLQPKVVTASVPIGQYQVDSAPKGYSNQDNQDKSKKDKLAGETSIMGTSKDINKLINSNTVAEFGFYENTNKVIIKIKDKYTNEVIKEIPSEKSLEIFEKALELAGILVDEKR
ncbi:flagellar protein FlaG [[Clostridium] fimetarium]|uniref:Flagellar protein FlaG n=1 Tax=[Clostridium] fimetarium TaxID=99656 RepID=A0A1I0P5W9_9FIRM|nr:flagellar protein FlaG [[Clostridium] fimetarium]SEW08919.1 flagellar protein FlaG [[Clostridium] fimetarium]